MAVLTERTEASVDGIASPADVNLPLGFALLAVDVVAIGTVAKDELIEILHVALATHEKVTCVARRAPGVGNAVRAEHLSAVLADFHLRSGRETVAATAPFLVSVAMPEVKAGSVFGEVQKLNLFVNPLQHKAVALHPQVCGKLPLGRSRDTPGECLCSPQHLGSTRRSTRRGAKTEDASL